MATGSPHNRNRGDSQLVAGTEGSSVSFVGARDVRSDSHSEIVEKGNLDSEHEDGETDESSSPGPKDAHPSHKEGDSSSQDGTTSPPSLQEKTRERQGDAEAPPPREAPPLPSEPQPPASTDVDDGWQPIWDPTAQAYYFYNSLTQASTWVNPRLPPEESDPPLPAAAPRPHGGYDPSIHGDYDPTAPYAQDPSQKDPTSLENASSTLPLPSEDYTTAAHFSRFSSRFVNPDHPANASHRPDHHDDEHKSKRQMSAFFDVDAAANSHDGRSLKAERQGKKLSKKEVKAFKEKRKSRKEEKRRAWLRD